MQIKARSLRASKKNASRFAALEIRKPRQNYFFIFYCEHAKTYWIIPSLELVGKARRNKTGKNKGKFSINFTRLQRGTVQRLKQIDCYRNKFKLLRNYRRAFLLHLAGIFLETGHGRKFLEFVEHSSGNFRAGRA